jgi:dihydrofolate reductase
MRTLILQEFLTLEGFAAGPKNSVDFVPACTKDDRSFGREQLTLMDEVDTILLGRVTYEMFAGYWPNTKGEEKAFGDRMSATPRIVFSTTLDRAPWGAWPDCRIVRTDPAEEVAKLKRGAGKNIVLWGSISVAQHLMKVGQVDEYRLVICPMVLGDGRPLFPDKTEINMMLALAKPLERGAVYLKYQPRVSGSGGQRRLSDRSVSSAAMGLRPRRSSYRPKKRRSDTRRVRPTLRLWRYCRRRHVLRVQFVGVRDER